MFISANVTSCDFNDITYDQPVRGAWALAKSATGGWNPVMFAGPEWLAQNPDVVPMEYDDAVAACEAIGGRIEF